MSKKLIHLVAAARPNFMKIAPLCQALRKESWAKVMLVHTGQSCIKSRKKTPESFDAQAGIPLFEPGRLAMRSRNSTPEKRG